MKTNLKEITKQAIKEKIDCKFLDYSLRFEVGKDEKEKVVDLDSLDLQDIEKLLEIRKVIDFYKRDSKTNYKVFDSWFDLIYFVDELQNDNRINVIYSIVGYEKDNEKIKLYWKSHYTNS